jgi:hypothetical protein
VHLGTVAGNANAVHLGIINRAAAAARAGRPATLFIYNEEDSDDQVSAASMPPLPPVSRSSS